MALEGTPLVAKIRLYPVSKQVTIICENGQTEKFCGPANFDRAQEVAERSAASGAVRQDLELDSGSGFGTTLIVPPGVEVETIREEW